VIEEEDVLRKRGLKHIDRIVAGSAYHECPLLQLAIHSYKYRRLPGLDEDLARLITKETPDTSAVLCPVPLHWSRKFQRGFNQAELLAKKVATSKGVTMKNLLKRVRPTGHQAWRNRAERFEAMQDTFRSAHGTVPEHVILIDDLSTTGATLDACAKALKEAGAKKVEGWVVAHG
jgi:ComF family protein